MGIKYRADIDALRAFAVLPVVLFHLDEKLIPGGYLGVDVFFVISGYLITRLLVSEIAIGSLDLVGFWRRRILRILPALIVMVAVTFVLGQWILFAPDRHDLAINSAAALLSFSNITHWLNYGAYWGADANTSPLLHTWSLGVEEQFYVLYPLFIWIVWRFRPAALKVVLAAGLFASLSIFIYGVEKQSSATFYLLPTRAWELAAGALAARINWSPEGRPVIAKAMALTGLALTLCAYAFASAGGLGYWSIAAVAGAALVVGVGTDAPFRSLGLTNRGLVFVGLISYSLYLWHWPVIVLSQAVADRYSTGIPAVILLLLMLGFAVVSWRFVEAPMRRATGLAPIVVGTALTMALVAFALRDQNGREDLSAFKPTRWAGSEFSVNPEAERTESVKRRMAGIQVTGGGDSHDAYAGDGIVRRYGGKSVDVLVLGDSHGLMWAPVIDRILKETGKTGFFMTADGTKVFFDPSSVSGSERNEFFTGPQLAAFKRARLRVIREQRPGVVVIGARWSGYSAADAQPLMDEIIASGARVILLGDPPLLDIGDRNLPQFLSYVGVNGKHDIWLQRADLAALNAARETLATIASSCPSVCSVVQTSALFRDAARDPRMVHVVADGHVLYIDDDHLSVAGAELAGSTIRQAMVAVKPRAPFMAPAAGTNDGR